MTKKLLVSFFMIFILFFGFKNYSFADGNSNISSAKCSFSVGNGISDSIEKCVENTGVYKPESSDLKANSGFKKAVGKIIINISLYLAIFAVGAIVYASLMLVISTGDNDKINKAKEILKWSIIGFLGVIFSAAIVNLIINVFYGK